MTYNGATFSSMYDSTTTPLTTKLDSCHVIDLDYHTFDLTADENIYQFPFFLLKFPIDNLLGANETKLTQQYLKIKFQHTQAA